MKKYFKYIIVLIFLIFIFTYYFGSNVFEYKLKNKKVLTEEQIEKFEEDIKKGNKIDITEYVVKEKNYDNIITVTSRKISKYIDKGFENLFKYLLKYIET